MTNVRQNLINVDKWMLRLNLLGGDSDDAVHVGRHVPRQHDSDVCVDHFS